MSLFNTETSLTNNNDLLSDEFLQFHEQTTYPCGFEEIMDRVNLEDIETEKQNKEREENLKLKYPNIDFSDKSEENINNIINNISIEDAIYMYPPCKMKHSCRRIEVESIDYEKLVTNKNDGCALIEVKGSWAKWYLCCRMGKHYFIQKAHYDKSLDGYSTTTNLIDDLINKR
jgi:hypothetical protein